MAFAHGWSDGTNLSLSIDSAKDRDDVIRVSTVLPFWDISIEYGKTELSETEISLEGYLYLEQLFK